MALRETITIRPYQDGDEEAILATWNRVHARANGPQPVVKQGVLQGFSLPPRAPAAAATAMNAVAAGIPGSGLDGALRGASYWSWMFRENPSGTRVVLGFDEGGEVLVQVAGVPLRARLAGRNVVFCRLVDPLNARSQRTNQLRRGLFTAALESFRETYGGEGDGRHAFAYSIGAPSSVRAARAYAGFGLLDEDHVHELAVGRAPSPDFRVEVSSVDRFGPEATEVFERVATEHQALVVRDTPFLNWRFADAPGRPYTLLVARERGRVAGLAVWRPGRRGRERVGVAAEWLVPRDEPHAARSLVADMAERTRAIDGAALLAACAPSAREWLEWQEQGFVVRRTGAVVAGASHARAWPSREFARHLHRTLSDTEWA